MTRIAKLYDKLLANPRASIRYGDFEKLLRAFRFEQNRTKGSHMIWVHPKVPRPFPIQPDGKDAKSYQIRDFLELVEEYGLYIEP